MNVDIKASDLIDKVFGCFKKITPALIFCALASSCVLFLPKEFLEKIGLGSIPSNLRTIIGIIFIVFTSAIFVIAVFSIGSWIRDRIKRKRLLKNLEKNYLKLNDEQKAIIRSLLASPEKSGYLSSTSGNTLYLQNNGFIYFPQQVVEPYTLTMDSQKLIYCLQPWVIDLFANKPELFQKP